MSLKVLTLAFCLLAAVALAADESQQQTQQKTLARLLVSKNIQNKFLVEGNRL